MQERRFGVFELLCNIACEAEVWILVDGAGDEAGDVGYGAEYLGEGVLECRCGLDRGKVDFADVVSVVLEVSNNRPARSGTHESVNPKVAFAWLYVI